MIIICCNIKHPLFKRDLLNVCCRNDGEFIQLSYRKKYIQQGLANINGKEGLIVFADYSTTHGYIYHPIRKVEIRHEDVVKQGPILLKLKLGDLIKYPEETPLTKQLIAQFHDELERNGNSPKAPEQLARLGITDKGSFVFDFTPTTLTTFDIDNDDPWRTLCNYLGKETELKDSVFFRQDPGKLDLGARSDENKALKIDSNKSYRLFFRVLTGDATLVAERYPQIFTNDNISCHGPFSSQYQGAIRAEYLLVAKSSLARINTSLTIKVKDDKLVVSPEISHFVKVRPPLKLLLLVLFLFVIGIAAFNAKDEFDKNDILFITQNIYINIRTTLAIVGGVAPILGTLLAFNKISFFSQS